MMSDQGKNMRDDDAKLLASLVEQLAERIQTGSELPWLEVSVTSQIEARECARRWLSDNGSLFRSQQQQRKLTGSLDTLQYIVSEITVYVSNTRFWGTLGAMAGGGGIGYFIATYFTAQEPTTVVSISLVAAITGVLAAGAAAQWPYLREFYS